MVPVLANHTSFDHKHLQRRSFGVHKSLQQLHLSLACVVDVTYTGAVPPQVPPVVPPPFIPQVSNLQQYGSC